VTVIEYTISLVVQNEELSKNPVTVVVAEADPS
jgi:hypothetical protein